MDQWPTVPEKVPVAPKSARERRRQRVLRGRLRADDAAVRHVALAVEEVLAPERVYLLSLGSQQGNTHVHWHVAALPPGVPYEQHQFHALMAEHGAFSAWSPVG